MQLEYRLHLPAHTEAAQYPPSEHRYVDQHKWLKISTQPVGVRDQ